MVLTASGRAATSEPAAPRPRRWLVAGALVGGLVLAGALALLVRSGDRPTAPGPETDLLPVPPRGSAAAEVLDDGTPVFVVHARAGDVYVVVAGLGLGEGGAAARADEATVGWCPRARTFEDPTAGHLFDARGRPLGGRPPSGLALLPVERVDERSIAIVAGRAAPLDDHRRTPPTGRPCLEEPHLLVVHDEVTVRAG